MARSSASSRSERSRQLVPERENSGKLPPFAVRVGELVQLQVEPLVRFGSVTISPIRRQVSSRGPPSDLGRFRAGLQESRGLPSADADAPVRQELAGRFLPSIAMRDARILNRARAEALRGDPMPPKCSLARMRCRFLAPAKAITRRRALVANELERPLEPSPQQLHWPARRLHPSLRAGAEQLSTGGVMPERRAVNRARRARREGKRPTTQAREFLREEIHHVPGGKHGARSTKRAIEADPTCSFAGVPPRRNHR